MLRMAAKGIIVRDSKVLLVRAYDTTGDWYMLPGGGRKPGETLQDTLVRECREELAVEPEVGELLYVREFSYMRYKGSHLERQGREVQQMDFIFACTIPAQATPRKGDELDSTACDITLEIEWVPLKALDSVRIYPAALADILQGRGTHPTYLGECY